MQSRGLGTLTLRSTEKNRGGNDEGERGETKKKGACENRVSFQVNKQDFCKREARKNYGEDRWQKGGYRKGL